MRKNYLKFSELRDDAEYLKNAIPEIEELFVWDEGIQGGVPMFGYRVKTNGAKPIESAQPSAGAVIGAELAEALKSALGIGSGINAVVEGLIDTRLRGV